ncbi:dihydrofolate reductase [Bifidobacterium choloepi]|uniref:dihydrofolate reductase n=1 Tax=Bifidobacterium choloepi TaxID=2614131 RepID=A0A6I5NAV4_9BIFI|nr:dihydrofolate reductase [Bifidobacterium choloepi]NEG69570.1 dihydrofolate reductase [Bifidobacterium choloepi]
MEHDSSRSGYHEPEPGVPGRDEFLEDDWGDDYPKTFSINLIWAQAQDSAGRDGVIGYQGAMPWHLGEDLRRFKELTVGHPVIMGRKTWESLNPKYRPLPGRDNIVVSRRDGFTAPGAVVVDSIEDALDIARQEAIPDDGLDRSEIWVIGGAQLFQQMMPEASKIFLTQIDSTVPADTYAPDVEKLLESGDWTVVEKTGWKKPADADDIKRYRFLVLEHSSNDSSEEE